MFIDAFELLSDGQLLISGLKGHLSLAVEHPSNNAKSVLIVGLLQSKRPADGSTERRKRLKRRTDAAWNAADSDVRPTVIGHHI